MSSMAAIPSGSVKPGGTLTYPSFIPSKNHHPCFLPFRTSVISINPTRASTYKHSSSTINLNLKHQTLNITARKFTASATTEAVETEISSDPAPTSKESEPSQPTAVVEKVGRKVEKPKLILKFIWMEKNIGLGLDQKIGGHGTVPLSPYYFWPRKDAWEELKTVLESKPWISQKKMIILLNQATDIINLWQQSGGSLSQQQ
ncbi:hypothetical protein M9H77_09538 [Catharanthus roseus]|uniref:Uncharacterized protein n=1 Tax=Catharanthus roseus TaxID=4058 RepID=A0ACC0C1C3_CATRO|nr:hypothetical protein M9H77_09538 [Catharanthus roseus]